MSADGTGMRGSRHPPPKRALPRSVMPVLEATGAAPEFEEGVRTACWVRGVFHGPGRRLWNVDAPVYNRWHPSRMADGVVDGRRACG